MRVKKSKKRSGRVSEPVKDYDYDDTTAFIDKNRPLKFEGLGLRLPEQPPTQVVSIRLPTDLLNQIKAIGSQNDVPYQALIKLYLADAVKKKSG